MNIESFSVRFPNEAACKASWKEYRLKMGVVCPRCGSRKHYWKPSKECFECRKCGYRQMLRANTLMHGSHMSIRCWFFAAYMLAYNGNELNISDLQHQYGSHNWTPVAEMINKIRMMMDNLDFDPSLRGEDLFTAILYAGATYKNEYVYSHKPKKEDL